MEHDENFTEKEIRIREIKRRIFLKATIEYHDEWLKHHGLKIGDKVMARFSCEHGTHKQSWHRGKDCFAIIKRNQDGTLCLESTEGVNHSINVNNGRTGRSRKNWWEYYKSIDRVDIENMINPNGVAE